MPLQMTSRFWWEKSLPKNHPLGQRQPSSWRISMPISCMINIMQQLFGVCCKPPTPWRPSPNSRVTLALTFGSHSKSGKVGSQTTAIETTASVISEVSWEPKLSKNSWQRQHKINQQAAKISSLEVQNQKLAQLLEPKFLVETITKAVASNLNINMDKISQQEQASGYTGRPYLRKSRPSKLAPGINGSLNPELSCWYCKDTGHLKENCVKLNRRLALENKQPDWLPGKQEN